MSDQKLEADVAEVFEMFNVHDSTCIAVGDVSVALRMLGVEVGKDRLRGEILPEYSNMILDGKMDKDTFIEILTNLKGETSLDPDAVFSALDSDQSGVLTSKSMQLINQDLVSQGLETTEYTLEALEHMMISTFNQDHITKERFRDYLETKTQREARSKPPSKLN